MDSLPFPISFELNRYQAARNPRERFFHLYYVFSFTIRYMTLIALSDYFQEKNQSWRNDPSNKLLNQHLERPSLRDCRNMLVQVVTSTQQNHQQMFLPELLRFLVSETGEPQEGLQSIDRILSTFEANVSPTMGETQYQAWVDSMGPDLLSFLDTAQFLGKYWLVRVVGIAKREDKYQWNLKPMTGLSNDNRLLTYQSAESSFPSVTGLWNSDAGEILPLYPLIIFRRSDETGDHSLDEELLLYERLEEQSAVYISTRPSVHEGIPSRVALREVFDSIQELIARLLEPVARLPFDWQSFAERANKLTREQIDNLSDKYQPDLYTNRHYIETELGKFIDSPITALVLIGESGMGKTNLLCNISQRLMEQGHCTLLYNCGGTRLTLTPSLADNLADDLFPGEKVSFRKLLEVANESASPRNKKIILLFDAINEFSYGQARTSELLAQIDQLVSDNADLGSLRIILTCRSITWRQLEVLGQTKLSWIHYRRNENADQVLSLEKFESKELESAYAKYKDHFQLMNTYRELSDRTQNRLQDPLLLRLTATVFKQDTIPLDAPTLKVFAEYFQKQIGAQLDLRSFLNNMVEEMFQNGTDTLSFLEMQDSGKFKEITSNDLRSAYVRLKDLGILLELSSGLLPEVRFTYDRFFEYLLARYLLDRMRREKREEGYLLELAERYRQFSPLWGTLKSMLLLESRFERWRAMAASTDYVARDIFVDAMQEYFGEEKDRAVEIMLKLLDDKSSRSTQTVLRAAGKAGMEAIDVFTHAMESTSEDTRRILINFLVSVARDDSEFGLLLYQHYSKLVTLTSIVKNRSIGLGAIELLLRVLAENVHDFKLIKEYAQVFQRMAVDQLRLMQFGSDTLIDKTIESAVVKAIQFVLNKGFLGTFIELVAFNDFGDPKAYFQNKEEQNKRARLIPYFDVQREGFEEEIMYLPSMLQQGPLLAAGIPAVVLAIQMNGHKGISLNFFKELFERCDGYGRTWLLGTTFALWVPVSPPEGYLGLLEELTVRYVEENRQNLFEFPIQGVYDILDFPLMSLCMSYHRDGATDMPVIRTLIGEAINKDDRDLAKRLLETVFPLGVFYPRFVLEFTDRNGYLKHEWLVDSILKGLAFLVPLHSEIVDLFMERWGFATSQKDFVNQHADDERPYKTLHYTSVWNTSVYGFTNRTALTQLGFGAANYLVTANSVDEIAAGLTVGALKLLREHRFDLATIFLPESERGAGVEP